MRRLLHGFLGAWSLLTRVPLPGGVASEPPPAGAAAFLPLVGVLFGLCAWAIYLGVRALLPEAPSRALVLAIWYLLSGGLHLDGFADTVDGWGGGRTREEALQVMRDPHVGAMGAAAVALLLIVKLAALGAIPSGAVGPVLVAVGACGRWAPVYAAWRYRPAREEGLGKAALEGTGAGEFVAATAVAALASGFFGGLRGVVGAAAGMVAAVLLALAIARWLGGHTGDTYGFLVEVTETVALLAAATAGGPL